MNNIQHCKCHETFKLLEKEKDKNDYLSLKLDIHESKKNIGEKDELLSILELYNWNKIGNYAKLVHIFGSDASDGISIIDPNTNSLLVITNMKKSKSGSKSDIQIQMNKTQTISNVSIKSNNGSKPSILNHTPRTANVFNNTGILHKYLPSLDILIEEYINKRIDNIISEDAPLCVFECMKEKNIYQDVIDVLLYFIFDGTGKGLSKNQANSILLIDKNISFIECYTLVQKKLYVESLLEKCVISLRQKGMPPQNKYAENPWCFQDKITGHVKGCLHIRMK